MNDICVEVKSLSKCFLVPKQRTTAFRVLKALLSGQSWKHELWILREITFTIEKGDKLAIIGDNGSGKTTLLRILSGIYEKTSGYLNIPLSPKVLFRCWIGFNGELSVVDNIYLFGAVYGIRRDFLNEKINNILQLSQLEHLRFASLKTLSSGQLQRLAFSIFMQAEDEFLIFDESLTFVDQLFGQKCCEYFKKLAASDKTVIMTAHDSSFLRKYCHQALWLEQGRIRMHGDINKILDEYDRRINKNSSCA